MQIKHILMALLVLTLGVGTTAAQDFDPVNPPEPQATYKLTVRVDPAEVGYGSGSGRYRPGDCIEMHTSGCDIDYRFKQWIIDGVASGDSDWEYYTMPEHDVEVVAVYEFVPFDPESPDDPAARNMRRLYLQCEPEDACSFNFTSGMRHEQGSSVSVQAYASQGYRFMGWYDGDTLVSATNPFDYTIPADNSTLTARYVYDPDSPADPTGGQGDVENPFVLMGDVNNDGILTVTDVVWIVSDIFDEPFPGYNRAVADLSHDGIVTVSDIVLLIDTILE